MNSAHAVDEDKAGAPRTGAEIISKTAPGSLPTRTDTVRAEVLGRLLACEHLTGMDGVFEASTTRLADAIHALKHDYEWRAIKSENRVVGTRDGRAACIVAYFLPQPVIDAAMLMGAAAWMAQVRAARAARRVKSFEAKRKAARDNVAAPARSCAGSALGSQSDLFAPLHG